MFGEISRLDSIQYAAITWRTVLARTLLARRPVLRSAHCCMHSRGTYSLKNEESKNKRCMEKNGRQSPQSLLVTEGTCKVSLTKHNRPEKFLSWNLHCSALWRACSLRQMNARPESATVFAMPRSERALEYTCIKSRPSKGECGRASWRDRLTPPAPSSHGCRPRIAEAGAPRGGVRHTHRADYAIPLPPCSHGRL